MSLREAAQHPHIKARGTLVVDELPQPAPAPRFSLTPAALSTPPPAPGRHTRKSWPPGVPAPAELRALVDLATRTEVPAEVLRETAQRLRDIPPALRARTRKVTEPASVDDLAGGVRMLNPVIGAVYAHGGVNAMLLDQVLGHAAGPDRRGHCPASPAQRSRPAR
jgi:hypothetical protein